MKTVEAFSIAKITSFENFVFSGTCLRFSTFLTHVVVMREKDASFVEN